MSAGVDVERAAGAHHRVVAVGTVPVAVRHGGEADARRVRHALAAVADEEQLGRVRAAALRARLVVGIAAGRGVAEELGVARGDLRQPLPRRRVERLPRRHRLLLERRAALSDSPADKAARLAEIAPVMHLDDLLELQSATAKIDVRTPIAEYALRVIQATRTHPAIQLGASPRAAMAWLKASRARALLDNRSFVLPDDLKAMALSTLAHRIFMRHGDDAAPALREILKATPIPL